MRPAMRPYSIAVAPLSFRTNFWTRLRMLHSILLSRESLDTIQILNTNS
jgi:hypothetical protein